MQSRDVADKCCFERGLVGEHHLRPAEPGRGWRRFLRKRANSRKHDSCEQSRSPSVSLSHASVVVSGRLR